MKITEKAQLTAYNTFGINAIADYLVQYHNVDELKQIIEQGMLRKHKYLHVGKGSNLLFLNDFQGVVLHSEISYFKIVAENESMVEIEVGAGVEWDEFVEYTVRNQFFGIENLSLIPGEVGAAAIQNIGAYGSEACETIKEVHAVNLKSGDKQIFKKNDCKYGYRESIFKNEYKNQFAIVAVVFELSKKPVFNLSYQQLEKEVLKNGEINADNIRNTIIRVRNSKLPDPKIYGNAGSFFMNPVVSKALFNNIQSDNPEMPHYFVSDSEEKIPAAWLIDQCGWKGRRVGNAGVHSEQALVIINKGGATGTEIVHLAELIQQSVFNKFGIRLQPEVNYIS